MSKSYTCELCNVTYTGSHARRSYENHLDSKTHEKHKRFEDIILYDDTDPRIRIERLESVFNEMADSRITPSILKTLVPSIMERIILCDEIGCSLLIRRSKEQDKGKSKFTLSIKKPNIDPYVKKKTYKYIDERYYPLLSQLYLRNKDYFNEVNTEYNSEEIRDELIVKIKSILNSFVKRMDEEIDTIKDDIKRMESDGLDTIKREYINLSHFYIKEISSLRDDISSWRSCSMDDYITSDCVRVFYFDEIDGLLNQCLARSNM